MGREVAEALKEISPHQFEWWAVDLVNARPAKDHKKGADIRRLTDFCRSITLFKSRRLSF